METKSVLSYNLDSLHYQNGYFEVWKGSNNLGQKATVKVLKRAFINNQRAVEEFRREATVAANISHPNILRVFGLEDSPQNVAILREDFDGEFVKKLVEKNEKLSEKNAMELIADFLTTLSFVHKDGVILANINHENILISRFNKLKITDFSRETNDVLGISTVSSNYSQDALSFKSPEQMLGETFMDQTTDIYSTGILLYYLLAGSLPYRLTQMTLAEFYASIVEKPLPEIPGLSLKTTEFIKQACAKNRHERFSSANKAIEWLNTFQPNLVPHKPTIEEKAGSKALVLCKNAECKKPIEHDAKFCGFCGKKLKGFSMFN